MIVWRMCITCQVPKATNTHSDYVIRIAFPCQKCLRVHVSMLTYTNNACLVIIWQPWFRKCVRIWIASENRLNTCKRKLRTSKWPAWGLGLQPHSSALDVTWFTSGRRKRERGKRFCCWLGVGCGVRWAGWGWWCRIGGSGGRKIDAWLASSWRSLWNVLSKLNTNFSLKANLNVHSCFSSKAISKFGWEFCRLSESLHKIRGFINGSLL